MGSGRRREAGRVGEVGEAGTLMTFAGPTWMIDIRIAHSGSFSSASGMLSSAVVKSSESNSSSVISISMGESASSEEQYFDWKTGSRTFIMPDACFDCVPASLEDAP